MANGFGMGEVNPQAIGSLLAQGVASSPSPSPQPAGAYMPDPMTTMQEHSPTATAIALSEAMTRMGNGVRRGEYQHPSTSIRLEQLKRAGLSPAEIQILLRSEGE